MAPNSGIIKGTLSYDEPHTLTSDARAVVVLVDVTAGAADGTVVAQTSIKDPGPQPVKFQLAYPFAVVNDKDEYRVYAGIDDGDAAWATPTGVSVDVPQPEITGVKLQLEYRPDLLKGAVSGTITGAGLDPTKDPDSYGTSILLDASTGATIGFQLISPTSAVPIPYSVPYDPSTIDQSASYVARGSVWDGTALWNTPAGVPVITNDNPKSDVVLTVVPDVTSSDSGGLGTWWILLLLALIVAGIIAAVIYMRRAGQADEGPIAPPPPPGAKPTSPPPPPSAAGAAGAAGATGSADPGSGAPAAGEPVPDTPADPAPQATPEDDATSR